MAERSTTRVLAYCRRAALLHDGGGLSDANLLSRFVEERDQTALEAILRRHGPMVFGACRRLLHNHHDAEDAFQATFLVLVRRAATVRPREMLANWLYGVAYQTARKARALAARRVARERQVTDMPEPESRPPGVLADWQVALDRELSRLPDKYRVPVVLCDLEGRGHHEAAHHLGWPPGTLSGRLSRARRLLARRLSRHGVTFGVASLTMLLSEQAASAGVPATLMNSTVKAACLIAAGQATTASVVSAPVAALTEGVLHAMWFTKLKVVATGLVLMALAGFGAGIGAQGTQERKPRVEAAPPRPGVRPETRGLLKSLDAAASKITVQTGAGREPGMELTFNLAKDVEVAVGDGNNRRGLFKEAKLADLSPGIFVTLTFTADQSVVESIAAEGPTTRAQLKSVDAAKNTVTVNLPPSRVARGEQPMAEEKTFPLAANAEVALDDGRGRRFSVKEAKLGDLQAGSLVTLWLTVDQKQVLGILAEGPALNGVIKSVDASKNSLTLTLPPSRGATDAEERTIELAPGAVTMLDDGRGRRLSIKEAKLAEVPVGGSATVRLTPDQKQASQLRVEGANIPGMLKAIDPDKRSITIAMRPAARGDNPEEKSWTVAKDARVVLDGVEIKLADLKVEDNGPFVMLRLTLDQKSVQGIQAGRGRR